MTNESPLQGPPSHLANGESREDPHPTLSTPRLHIFISRDTCSDSIAKPFRACFYVVSHTYRANVAKWGIAQMCLCQLSTKGGYRTILGDC